MEIYAAMYWPIIYLYGLFQDNLFNVISQTKLMQLLQHSVADPGFPVGGVWTPVAAKFRKICMSK